MPTRMTLIRDYLQRALVVLPLDDPNGAELKTLLERAVALTRTTALQACDADSNVIEFHSAAQRLRPA